MALFDVFKKRKERERFERQQKKKEDVIQKEEEKEKKPGALIKASTFASKVIIKPHITEKSTNLNAKREYVFKIAKKANKIMVRRAIQETYGVMPEKINIINVPSKKIFLKGRSAHKPGYKKALVCLKEGDKIEVS